MSYPTSRSGNPPKQIVQTKAGQGDHQCRRPGLIPRLLQGTGAGAVAYALGTTSNLFLLPLYLRSWSVTIYGEWMAIYSLVNYFASLDFGVTAAGVNAATMAYACGDWERFKRAQGTAWAAAVAIAAGGLALVVAPFLLYFRVERWLGLKALVPGEARLVFCCLAASLLLNIPGRQLIAVYIAIGEFAKYQWLYNAFFFATCISTAVCLAFGGGPVFLASVTLGVTVSTLAGAAWLLQRRDPRFLPSIRDADWGTARTLAAPTGQFGLSILATVLSLQAPVVVLSRAFGGPAVALFTTTRTVANVIRQSLALFRAPLRPELAARSATASKAAISRIFRLAIGVDIAVGVALFAGLWAGGGWLIRFWSRGRIDPSPGFLHLILITVLMEGFFVFIGSMGWSTNRAQVLAPAQLATAAGSILLALPLLRHFGISAIPLGAIAPLLIIMAPVGIRDVCKHTDLSGRFVVTHVLLPFAGMSALSAFCSQRIADLRIAPEWIAAPASAIIACALSLLLVAFILGTPDDRQTIINRILPRTA